jgi:hypothetical protein
MFLSAASLVTCGILLLRPPHAAHYHPHFTFEPGFWLTMGVSVVAVVVSALFGGKLAESHAETAPPSKGRVLH